MALYRVHKPSVYEPPPLPRSPSLGWRGVLAICYVVFAFIAISLYAAGSL